jgi:hypothetical protein
MGKLSKICYTRLEEYKQYLYLHDCWLDHDFLSVVKQIIL